MRRSLTAVLWLLLLGAAEADPRVTLESIMRDPSWIGQWPQQVRFVPGERNVLYLRRAASRGTEVVEVDRKGKTLRVTAASSLPGQVSVQGKEAVYSWLGDLFLSSQPGRRWSQTQSVEGQARWAGEQRLLYNKDETWFLREQRTGQERQLARLHVASEASPESRSTVEKQQDRLFPVLQERQEEQRRTDRSEIPEVRLEPGREVVRSEVTSDGRWLLVAHRERSPSKADQMPDYVTRDGFVATRPLRVKVGDQPASHQQLSVFSLTEGRRQEVSFASLPGWSPGRAVRLEEARWSGNGRLALLLLSQDFKDRWLVEVDFAGARLVLIEHLHDPAWHTWDLQEFDWMPEGEALWYQSERTGYAHLYLWDGLRSRALTSGAFEVSSIKTSPDGRFFYFRANRQRPTNYDVYRVDRAGNLEAVTTLGGNTGFDLSFDGQEIAFLHSTITHPPEIYLQNAEPGAKARRLTQTVSAEFSQIPWTLPRVIEVPSTHQARPIPAKLYLPPQGAPEGGAAVVFVHGAGYLQNSDEAWSYYFREFMFHTLLNTMGVTVLDMDYRASAGYGRDWRAAIAGRMGEPELQDLTDGVAYLVREHRVAPDRVGIYGGSYGGFMTLMALFKAPELFACGAALRPVTDWAQYEHEYTARILGTPDQHPEAFRQSSPIEWAEGLQRPLLICHGLLDDNVVAQDTLRLTQRLIALEKENWETALYPVEPHGFVEASSWLDQYRRILKLFRTHLKLP